MKRTVSAMEFRRKLGEILEGVFYRGDEVKIERNGKLMGVIVSPDRYEQTEQSRNRSMDTLFELFEKNWEHNKDVPPEVLEREVNEAVREMRGKNRAEPRAKRAG
jgi:hypothetical protein